MGRRHVNLTKSGKFMNPTDQARKEARKRELKKNKKQRMAVRHAVLKAKDPIQLLEETALYDKQEYDPSVESQLNERVLQEKRKKLLETFDRLVVLYRKEDAEYANRLQTARQDYDKRRHTMMLYYEQVKLAERVKASEIPLPKLPQSQLSLTTSEIPLPTGSFAKSILKKSIGAPGLPPGILPMGRKPPGPPPGPVPELSDSDGEDDEMTDMVRQRRIRFVDGDSQLAQGADLSVSIGKSATSLLGPPINAAGFSAFNVPPSQIPLPPPTALPSFTGLIRPGFPGAPQSNSRSRLVFQHPGGAILSAPPSLHPPRDPLDNADQLLSHQHPATNATVTANSNVGSASSSSSAAAGTTIEAKPRLKNLIGDATRFVPTALKVRRTTRDSSGRLITVGGGATNSGTGALSSGKTANAAVYDRVSRLEQSAGAPAGSATTSKDDAYEEFMREMDGLL